MWGKQLASTATEGGKNGGLKEQPKWENSSALQNLNNVKNVAPLGQHEGPYAFFLGCGAVAFGFSAFGVCFSCGAGRGAGLTPQMTSA
mmetsp:Transcript_56862/g.92059  ORF Transcript_56862/g.92059 Transcript_56862/m.92059 type:complete len:88 (-) Transcript_56862:1230-1493(-)